MEVNFLKKEVNLQGDGYVNSMVGVLSKCLRISNHYVVHFKYITIYIYNLSIIVSSWKKNQYSWKKEPGDELELMMLEHWRVKWLETMDCLKDKGDVMDPKEPLSKMLVQVPHVGLCIS